MYSSYSPLPVQYFRDFFLSCHEDKDTFIQRSRDASVFPYNFVTLATVVTFIFSQLQWEQREKQLVEENRQLKKSASSSFISQKEFGSFQQKIDNANETINHLKLNLSKVNVSR